METYSIVGLIAWLVFTILIAIIGNKRTIGGVEAFFISLIFSPVAGLIVVSFSKNIEEEKREEEIRLNVLKQTEILLDFKKVIFGEEKKPTGRVISEQERKVQEGDTLYKKEVSFKRGMF